MTWADGNGRMSRLLTLLILYKSGYFVGQYISIEKLISDTKENYYKALQESSREWHEGRNDYAPFVKYMLGVIVAAYREFAGRVEILMDKTIIPLTEKDMKVLENILWSELGTKQDYESEYGEKPLGEFVREIVGLDMNAAKAAFSQYLNDTNLDSRQSYFVNQIVEYIVHNGMLKDLSVLQEAPFTDQGSIVDIFTDLNVWIGIRKTIDQINANALAA